MTRAIQLLTSICTVVLFCVVTMAQEPVVNIDPHRHPNLAEAQRLMVKANEAIATAQKDNRYDMHGHATKARQLLAQASEELKAAAEEANRGGH
jgi:hypothetical protein